MTTETMTFTGREDRQRCLTAILESGLARPGVTLIAHVDCATHRIIAVRSIPTPVPPDVDGRGFRGASDPLSCALRAIAEAIVPRLTSSKDGSAPITGELVTVVCRHGEPVLEDTEWQFVWGWRYSNHHTRAFHGEVIVVTPEGWAGLLDEWSGALPVLRVPAGAEEQALAGVGEQFAAELTPSGSPRSDRAAPDEVGVGDSGSSPPDPHRGECLLCYLCRMLDEFGCDCRLRFARHYRAVRAPRATGLEQRLAAMGGFCDCEVLLNGYELRPEHSTASGEEDDDGRGQERLLDLSCVGVRAGSTQPCDLWRRLRR